MLIISINVISAANETNATISTNQTIKNTTTTPIKTSVSTPDTGFVYKKNAYIIQKTSEKSQA